jgi:hypothetical protein
MYPTIFITIMVSDARQFGVSPFLASFILGKKSDATATYPATEVAEPNLPAHQ